MLGWVHLLKAREPDAATFKRAIEVIERNAQSQLTLISDMLDMARISTGKMRLEMSRRQPDGGGRRAPSTACDRPPTPRASGWCAICRRQASSVSGDADRLLQMAWNILSNAVKFTGEGGLVVVSLRADRQGAHFTVADTGQGIDPKFLSQVFDRFKQADTTTARRSSGLGLGLALVKDLVSMHGGRVEADSPGLGLGSTFSVHLPNPLPASRDRGRSVSVPPTATTLEGVHVLIVEDDADAREIAARTISDAGGLPVTVGNATEALAALVVEHAEA